MNQDQVKGSNREFAAKVKQQWAELTDDEIKQAGGNIEQLAGIIQRKYGDARETVEGKLNEFKRGA